MQFKSIVGALSLSLILVGCSSSTDPTVDPGVLPTPAAGEGLQLTTPKWTLQPGEEKTMCLFTTLPDDGDIWVNRFEMGMLEYSHHFLIYRDISEFLGGEWETGWRECDMDRAIPFTGSQTEYEDDVFPDGVALKLHAGMKVILESHYINYTQEPIEAQATTNLYTVDPADVTDQAGTYITYNEGFTIPEGAGVGPNPEHIEDLVCEVPEVAGGVNFFSMSSHMHAHGREFNAWTHDLDAQQDIEHVYTNTNWSDPAIIRFPDEAPLNVTTGFRYACSFFNDTGEVINEGPSASDEMCMLLGKYYPVAPATPLGLDGLTVCLNGQLFY